MIQKQTYLVVADNSGAKEIQCIHVIGSTRKEYAGLGELIKCTVKKAIPGGTVKKSEVVEALIVRTRKEYRREDGSYIRFGDNAAVIVKDGELVGTRIFGPVAREVRVKGQGKYGKILSLAPEVV
jgi:large subunit ribosomal protein L14